jgi:hypothetical protein
MIAFDAFNGYPVEITYNPNVDPTINTGSLMIRTSDRYSNDPANYRGYGWVNYMESERGITVSDYVQYDNAGVYTTREIKPRYVIEIDSFTPDGDKYKMKKFRSLEIMGYLPSTHFQISWAYNTKAYGAPRDLIDTKAGLPEVRSHFPHRIGLNQRGNSISIKLEAKSVSSFQADGVANLYDFLEISDISLLWTKTSRTVKSASFNNAV